MPFIADSPISTSPLGPPGAPGLLVTGLTLTALSDPAVATALRQVWLEQGLVLFRGLSGEESHLALSRIFGALTAHPTGVGHNDLHPELADISFTGGDGNIVRIAGRELAHVLPWHADLVYFAEINRGGILRAIEPAVEGGDTGFLDKCAAWRTLPEQLKARCDGLSVIYWGDFRMERCRYAKGAVTVRRSVGAQRLIDKRHQFPRVAHPLVCAHPQSGETMLNFSPWFSVGIEGIDDAVAFALLDELAAHLDQCDHAYFHQWLPEDMVLWDNWRMLHCTVGLPPDGRRVMQRTTIMGDYGLGRVVVAPPGSESLERVSV
jgi:taurine dioxygenase